MRDYWLTQYILQAVGWGYILVAAILLTLAWRLPKQRIMKIAWTCGLAVLVVAIPARNLNEYREKREAALAFKQKQAIAMALFQDRCQKAGERIYRTVDNVEGFLLVNPRKSQPTAIRMSRDWPEAGLPLESTGSQYLMEFLYFRIPPSENRAEALTYRHQGLPGYRHVDVGEGDVVKRYSLREESTYDFSKASDPVKAYGSMSTVPAEPPFYSVIHESINDPLARENWVAGSHIKVVNRITGEILGELESYAFEQGMGVTSDGNVSWFHALRCPDPQRTKTNGYVRSFIEKVLQPRK